MWKCIFFDKVYNLGPVGSPSVPGLIIFSLFFYFDGRTPSLLVKSSPDLYRVALFPPPKCRFLKRARRKEKYRPEIEGACGLI